VRRKIAENAVFEDEFAILNSAIAEFGFIPFIRACDIKAGGVFFVFILVRSCVIAIVLCTTLRHRAHITGVLHGHLRARWM